MNNTSQLYMDYVLQHYGTDAVSLITYLDQQYMELSQEKQAIAYVEMRQILREWLVQWSAHSD